MESDFTALSTVIERLAGALAELVPVLEMAAAQAARGELPPLSLATTIQAAHNDLATLERCLPSSELSPSIDNLRTRVRQVQHASVFQLLDDLLFIRHRELDEYPPLAPVYAAAQLLKAQISKGSLPETETRALESSNHALVLLHRALSDVEDLTDHEWDTVVESFGAGLALAITRDRLHVVPVMERPSLPTSSTPSTIETRTQDKSAETPPELFAPPVESTGRDELAATAPAWSTSEEGIVPSLAQPPSESPATTSPTVVASPPATIPLDLGSPLETVVRELAAQSPPESRLVATLVWKLLERHDTDVAYQIVRSANGHKHVYLPPVALVLALAISPTLRSSDGALARLLRNACDDLTDLSETPDSSATQALRLLLACAMLRPAILAPETGAADLLHELRLRDGLPAFTAVIAAVATYGKFGVPLDPSALQELHNAADWQARADALAQRALEFRQRAPSLVISYQPAQDVLLRWLESDSLLGPLLNTVQRNSVEQLESVLATLNRYKDDSTLRREIDRTDRQVIGRRAGKDIHTRALTHLMQRARDAMALATEWVALHQERTGVLTYARQQAFRLRDALLENQEAAKSELMRYTHQAPPVVAVAAALAADALQKVVDLFLPGATLPATEPEPRLILQPSLLLLPGVELDDQWQPTGDATQLLVPLVKQLACGEPAWPEVLEQHLEARDHAAAGRLLEWLTTQDVSELPTLRQKQERHLIECRDALRRHLTQSQTLIESAVSLGLLREPERADLSAQVSVLEVNLPQVFRFGPAHASLDQIAAFIDQRKNAEADAVRRRLESVAAISPDARSRIEVSLASGDVLTANEYLDMVQNGVETLPDGVATESPFADFWPARAAQLGETLDKMPLRTLIRAISDQQSVPGLNMSMVPGAQARQAADLLETWFAAKSANKAGESQLQRIFSHFGFEVQSVTATKPGRRFEVVCMPFRSKDQCPVAFFGSSAAGRYRVLCVFDRPTEEDLINSVGETNQGSPCLVLYFGRLTEKRRRDLARLSRERRRTFLVIDDTLVLYLSSVRGARLPILFACTLPFTFLVPYTTRAGLVPPEMFYGRSRERDAVVDPHGSCFIYGGRQLGKTALLRDVARTFHQPENGQVAVYLDLKVEGIGYDRPVDEIWHLLAAELKKVRVLGANVSPQADAARVLDGMAVWLEAEPQRRLLLLLDEADRFLELDGQDEYRRSERIKGLMDRSDRRFKAVLAGLHNVQRSTRRVNHPLAHLGSAVCIGPLLDEGQWREARALIERPLVSLGYVFESPDLVTRILSQTNYYPSLIQLYVQQLLRHMQTAQATAADPRTPPFVITARHVEEAYRSGELRKAIRDRFMWTLQLDGRYELIAFALAYEIRSARAEDVLVHGLPVSAIRTEALRWWPEGFGDGAPEDSFRVLLEEMVGLGVLRTTGSGGYTLRSPNVVLLMGTVEEIEAQLLRPREAPLEYAPDSFRAAFRSKSGTDPVRRSPLTAQQESNLRQRQHGVTVIFGTEAAGITMLGEYLHGVFGAEFFHNMSGIMDRAGFNTELEALERTTDGVTLVYVPPECPWSEVWLQEALSYSRRRRSRTAYVRFVFASDPSQTLSLTRLYPDGMPSEVTSLALRPWHDHALRQWMDENSLLPDEQQYRLRIWQSTGGWTALLPQIVRGTRGSTHRWQQSLERFESDLQKRGVLQTLAEQFGLDRRPFRTVLRLVAQFPESSEADISALLEGMDPAVVNATLRASEYLHLVRRTTADTWSVENPIVLRLLQEVAQ